MNSRLAIIVPCFNEEEVLRTTTEKLLVVLNQLIDDGRVSNNSFILYVNDGSSDMTWSIIQKLHQSNAKVCGVNLAGNVGHQKALLAGLKCAVSHVDIMVTIDADLQDDETAIYKMVNYYHEGSDIVYGVRSSRKTDSYFKRWTAIMFYKMMRSFGIKTVYNHADFRLMSKKAVLYLLQFHERNIYLRGIIPLLGYKTSSVYYERKSRFAGDSKYTLGKMIGLAFDGVTSFTTNPIHFVLYLGLVFIFVAILIFSWATYQHFSGHTIPGWTSLILSIWFCSGCVLSCLGIIGEYIGKMYIEVKNRPLYHFEQELL